MSLVARFRQRYLRLAEPLRSERRLELALFLLLALALLQLLWLGWRGLLPPAVAPLPPAATGLDAAAPADPLIPDPAQRLALQARPLFWESRRPTDNAAVELAEAAANAEADAPAGNALGDVVLNGVFGGGDSGGVILSYRGNLRRLSVGEALDGWTLKSIGSGAAVFASGGFEATYRLQALPIAGGPVPGGAAARAQAAAPAVTRPSDAQSPAAAKTRPRVLSSGGLPAGSAGQARKQE